MRKFKHKKTGNIAVENWDLTSMNKCYNYTDMKTTTTAQIPFWAIEDSCDWEEINPSFISEDGVPIYKGMEVWIVYRDGYLYSGGDRPLIVNAWVPSGEDKAFYNKKAALEYAESIKPSPLFRTEDGVDIFDKSAIVYTIREEDWFLGLYRAENLVARGGFKIFSKEILATEYKLMNKPVLSLREVLARIPIGTTGTWDLKELVKSRI